MRAILHVDMDAFYASVEERDRPELAGKPLIVGGLGGRGVVAAASYAVRRFGVRSAMPMREALRRCPQAVCVSPRMARYREVSGRVFGIFRDFTPVVEGLSLDEAYLDVTGSLRLFGAPDAIARAIRARIRADTGLTASVGVAHNKLLAKIASDLDKPDGLFCIAPDAVHAVLDPLPVEKLPGIGPRTLPGVHAAGIRTIGELRLSPESVARRLFGRHAAAMQARAAGIDERPVAAEREEKSVSAEETFSQDISEARDLEARLWSLADRACTRLRAHRLTAASVHLKVRRADFRTYTRQRSLGAHTDATDAVARLAGEMLAEWRRDHPQAAVRLLGVGLGTLSAARQGDLFDAGTRGNARLDAAIDGIRGRFGAALITRASRLPRS